MSLTQKFDTKQIINLKSQQVLSLVTQFVKNNNVSDSIKYVERLTEIVPEQHDLWEILANLYKKISDSNKENAALSQLTLINNFNKKLNLAFEHFNHAKLQEADLLCRQLLQLVPNEIRTLRLLAKISAAVGRNDVALAILTNCIDVRHLDCSLAVEHADAQLKSGEAKSALASVTKYLLLHPNNLELLSIRAKAQVKTGDYQSAETTYRSLVEQHIDKALCLLRLGNVLKIVGKTSSAIDCYQQALTINPSLGEAYWNLSNTKVHIFSDSEINQMQAQLSASELDKENAMFLNFALGKAYDDKQQYASSFEYYKQANTLCTRPQQNKTNKLDKVKALFTKSFFNNKKALGHPSEEAIFIVGLPRSGSTLIEQILASHSLIDGTMELTDIPRLVNSLDIFSDGKPGHYPASVNQLSSSQINNFALKYLSAVKPFRKGGQFFTDKLPANFQHIGLIKLLFPNSKIIDVRRDPMACGWSIYSQFFASGVPYAFDLQNIGEHYNKYVDMMDHWHKVLPQQILSVKYESLISDFESTVQSILDYCNIEMEQGCLNYFKNERPVATPSAEQVRQAPYTKALEHWRHYEEFLLPLSNTIMRKQ